MKTKLIKQTREDKVHDRKYTIKCGKCGKEKEIGYKYLKQIFPSKGNTKQKSSGWCVACKNTKGNIGSFKKGQIPWNKGNCNVKDDYRGIHHWIGFNYGKADRCENILCEGKSKHYDWAKLPNKKYEKKRENFIRLCKRCHLKMDYAQIIKFKKISCKNCKKIFNVSTRSRTALKRKYCSTKCFLKRKK